MTSEQIRHRSDILNSQVITRDTGKRLGVVKELLVDIDQREVVALGLRDNLISIAGMPRYMYLNSIRQMGDVILVDDENVIEDIDVEAYSNLITCEVITETGELLGKVRGFKFNTDNGKVTSLIVASFGLPQIPDQFISTYELPIEEIVSSGPNRLIVFEGAEERLNQLTVGVLERLGIGKAPWDRDYEEGYSQPTIRPENQLSTGIPLRTPPAPQVRQPVVQETWDEDYLEEHPQPLPRRQAQKAYYKDESDDGSWSETSTDTSRRPQSPKRAPAEVDTYDDYEEDALEGDAWEDKVPPQPYKAPKVQMPEKPKQPEYEGEGSY